MTGFFDGLAASGVVYRLGWTLVHFVWEGAAAAALLAVALQWMGRRSANARYLVSVAGLVVMVLLPVMTFERVRGPAVVGGPGRVGPVVREGSGGLAARLAERRVPRTGLAGAAAPVVGDEGPVVPAAVPAAEGGGAATLGLGDRVGPWLPWVVGAWGLGVVVLSLYHLGGFVAVQRLRRLCTSGAGAAGEAMLVKLARRMRVSRGVRLLRSALVQTPVVVGYLRPVILVPASVLTGLGAAELEAILAHELAHIRRHDYLVNLGQALVETLLFYHPAVWWVSGRIRQEREHCCDDVAAAVCGDRVVDARALVSVEELRGGGGVGAGGDGGIDDGADSAVAEFADATAFAGQFDPGGDGGVWVRDCLHHFRRLFQGRVQRRQEGCACCGGDSGVGAGREDIQHPRVGGQAGHLCDSDEEL